MQDKVLFPAETDWKYARLIQRDGKYVIQSRYNETTKEYESEVEIEIATNACPEIQAFTTYCDTLCNAVCSRLRKREDYAQWVEENRIEQEEDNENEQQT